MNNNNNNMDDYIFNFIFYIIKSLALYILPMMCNRAVSSRIGIIRYTQSTKTLVKLRKR